jgi:L-ascorbate metabolism protein UlaG (beta-lactamase superfamily)
MADTTLTWLGHASFRFDSPGGTRVYVDPFLNGNPKCPEDELKPERVDVIALTHAHGDHLGDTIPLAQEHGATVLAIVELAAWLSKNGIDESKVVAFNKGGTVEAGGVKFTMVHAFHSSGTPDGTYAGEAAGIVTTDENGKRIYFAGDTSAFGDMQLIGRLYSPDLAVLPIGGHFTMDPTEAAVAVELLGAKRVLPCHYGSWPILVGTPEELRGLVPGDVTIDELEPGGSVTV